MFLIQRKRRRKNIQILLLSVHHHYLTENEGFVTKLMFELRQTNNFVDWCQTTNKYSVLSYIWRPHVEMFQKLWKYPNIWLGRCTKFHKFTHEIGCFCTETPKTCQCTVSNIDKRTVYTLEISIGPFFPIPDRHRIGWNPESRHFRA